MFHQLPVALLVNINPQNPKRRVTSSHYYNWKILQSKEVPPEITEMERDK